MGSSCGGHEAAAHVLAIPSAGEGHIIPMLRFATQLARRGITVSFVCYEDSLPRLTSTSGADESSDLQGLNVLFITEQNPHVEHAPLRFKQTLEGDFEPLLEKLTREKSAGIAGPTCLISDVFESWTVDAAHKLGVPRYALVPAGVLWARFMQGSLDYFHRGQFQASETDGKLVEFDWPVCISGIAPLRYHELGHLLVNDCANFEESAKSLMKSEGVLVNSFFELEEKVVEEFRNAGHSRDEHAKVPKIYTIGPLFSPAALTRATNVSGLEDSSSTCIRWLDSQPSSSVLYVAFGSTVRLKPEQIIELAYGLEASNQRFLWACPVNKNCSDEETPTPSITEVLPAGFEARVAGRGCVVTGWVPQLEVLAHSSTGGFFSHSGWNSSLESVIFGIPMISWPQKADQPMNCKFMVGELEVAIQLNTGKENFVERNEVKRAVRLLMVDSEGTAIRRRAEELKRKAAAAMAEDGSQPKNFQEFVDDISRF